MSPLTVALILFALAMVIFVIDLMIPSGGILLAITGIVAIISITFAFRHSPTAGLTMLTISSLSLPVMFWLFVKIWPKTPIGRRIISKPDRQEAHRWSDAAKNEDGQTLVGARGIATSEMLPSGRIKIGEKTFEAFSETGPIEKGAAVQVLRIELGRLIVGISREPEADKPMSDNSGLDRPLTEFDFDSIQ